LQLANDGVEGGEVVELESAQIRGVEIMPGHVDVIAMPERLLKFAISGRVQRHHAVVRLTCNRVHVLVRQRKYEARRSKTSAPRGEVGTIADVQMSPSHVRYHRCAFRGQVRKRADVDAQHIERLTEPIVYYSAQVIRSGTGHQVRHGTSAMRGRQRGQR